MISSAEHQKFAETGYLSGIRVWSAEEMAGLRRSLEDVFATDGIANDSRVHRHLDDPITYSLCTHPIILDYVAALLGPNILLWHSRYFDKPPGEPPIPWHQDAPFWNIEPKLALSAWIALDETNDENGCVEVIPSARQREIPHIKSEKTGRFGTQADPSYFDASQRVAIHLDAGEVFFFDRYLIHGSDRNRSKESRLGLSVRFTTPEVSIAVHKLSPPVPDYGVCLVRGQDSYAKNPVRSPPLS